jgi:hypothetical protein
MSTDGDPADDDDAALEGERYQGVRDLFRQAREHGFDEDPPARIDALLMAAAREVAEKKVGGFERVRRWLVATMMQPAVAGAVAIAVIGGTAGVLYMKGKGGVVEPQVSSTGAPPPAEPRTPTDKNVSVDLPGLEKERTATGNGEELQEKLKPMEDATRHGESERIAADPHARPKGDGSKMTGGSSGGGGAPGGGGGGGGGQQDDRTFDYRPDGRDTAVVIATDEGLAGGSGGVAVGGVTTHMGATNTVTEQPPPPDGTGATVNDQLESNKNVTSAPETTAARGDKRPPPSSRTQAENLLRQARTAAKKKACNTVRVMAKRAKQLDAAYYRDTFSRDAAVKDCL